MHSADNSNNSNLNPRRSHLLWLFEAQAVSGVKDTTSSLQDLAALCANAEEVTSPGSPVVAGKPTGEDLNHVK